MFPKNFIIILTFVTRAPATGALYARLKYFKKWHYTVSKGRLNLCTMGDNPRRFQDNPLKNVGGVVFTRICYICISKYLKKGHNSVRKGRIKKSNLYTQLSTMGDNPKRF